MCDASPKSRRWRIGGNLIGDPNALQTVIDRGLRGQLRMESLVTGVLYVALDHYPETPARFVRPQGFQYREIPTVPTERAKHILFAKLVSLRVARPRTLTESSISQPVPIGICLHK